MTCRRIFSTLPLGLGASGGLDDPEMQRGKRMEGEVYAMFGDAKVRR